MSRPTPSPLAVLLIAAGVIASVATTCGPPEDETGIYYIPDTGYYTGGTTDTEAPEGITLAWDGAFSLGHVGDTQAYTITATLTAGCLAEVEDYAWGYPTGEVAISYNFRPGTADTGGDSGGSETASPDTGDSGDTGIAKAAAVSLDTSDTGVSPDTGIDVDDSDTGVDSAGAPDTGAPGDTSDTSDTSGDTSGDTTGDTSGDTSVVTAEGVRVVVYRGDAGVDVEEYVPLSAGSGNWSMTDTVPYVSCSADAECTVTWTLGLELVEPQPVNGAVHVRARLHFCSSGPPETGDMTLSVE